ncbi:hypothetical protein RIF29_41167 [Crotalaria pallida]|uniref:Uncharacterized protein n=1 Tax=Crotalaria pallida TaxID=3830 RepID=A0AAN9E4J1_CROPI
MMSLEEKLKRKESQSIIDSSDEDHLHYLARQQIHDQLVDMFKDFKRVMGWSKLNNVEVVKRTCAHVHALVADQSTAAGDGCCYSSSIENRNKGRVVHPLPNVTAPVAAAPAPKKCYLYSSRENMPSVGMIRSSGIAVGHQNGSIIYQNGSVIYQNCKFVGESSGHNTGKVSLLQQQQQQQRGREGEKERKQRKEDTDLREKP